MRSCNRSQLHGSRHHHLCLLLLTVISLAAVKPTPDRRHIIDGIIHSAALRSYPSRHRTAVPYSVLLPHDLSIAGAYAVRFRAGRLRRHGTSVNNFRLFPGLVAHPHAKRLLIVFQNLGNLSDSLYSVPGYKLVSPVLGLLVYNAAGMNTDELVVNVTGKPIEVHLLMIAGVKERKDELVMCASFGLGGRVEVIGGGGGGGVCFAREQGHFGLVVEGGEEGLRRWKVVVSAAAMAAMGVVLLGMVVMAVVRGKRKEWRMAEMERQACDDEALRMSMVGNVRAYTAGAVRTAPELEKEDGLNM